MILHNLNLKYVVLLLFCMASNLEISSQSHSFIVKETDGTVIPFMYIVCEKSNKTLMSNNEGVVVMNINDFAANDTVKFQSMFYEPFYIEVGQLIEMKEVILQDRIINLPDVVVTASGGKNAENLVKNMSNNFSKNTAKDYATHITWLSTIECNGKYREFMGYKGLFASCNFSLSAVSVDWDDKNKRYLFPCTIMKSDQLVAGSDDILEVRSVAHSASDIAGLKIRYVNSEDDPWK